MLCRCLLYIRRCGKTHRGAIMVLGGNYITDSDVREVIWKEDDKGGGHSEIYKFSNPKAVVRCKCTDEEHKQAIKELEERRRKDSSKNSSNLSDLEPMKMMMLNRKEFDSLDTFTKIMMLNNKSFSPMAMFMMNQARSAEKSKETVGHTQQENSDVSQLRELTTNNEDVAFVRRQVSTQGGLEQHLLKCIFVVKKELDDNLSLIKEVEDRTRNTIIRNKVESLEKTVKGLIGDDKVRSMDNAEEITFLKPGNFDSFVYTNLKDIRLDCSEGNYEEYVRIIASLDYVIDLYKWEELYIFNEKMNIEDVDLYKRVSEARRNMPGELNSKLGEIISGVPFEQSIKDLKLVIKTIEQNSRSKDSGFKEPFALVCNYIISTGDDTKPLIDILRDLVFTWIEYYDALKKLNNYANTFK